MTSLVSEACNNLLVVKWKRQRFMWALHLPLSCREQVPPLYSLSIMLSMGMYSVCLYANLGNRTNSAHQLPSI